MPLSHNPWHVAEAVLGVSRRVLLRGKPGTGKTYAASKLGLKEGQKVYQITMTPETPMAELRGHFVQKGGEFVWHDGPATRAWREGARLVINEIDQASDDVLSLMYAIMDDPEFAELTLPSGETVRPTDGFSLVATMNGVPEDLPEALLDRLPVEIEITDLAEGALLRLPEDLREAAKNTALAKSAERSISVRMWMEFAHLRKQFSKDEDGLQTAAIAVFGDKADAALMALTVAESASKPIDALGEDVDENIVGPIRKYFVHSLRYALSTWEADKDAFDLNALLRDRLEGVKYIIEDHFAQTGEEMPTIRTATYAEIAANNVYINVDGIEYRQEMFVGPDDYITLPEPVANIS